MNRSISMKGLKRVVSYAQPPRFPAVPTQRSRPGGRVGPARPRGTSATIIWRGKSGQIVIVPGPKILEADETTVKLNILCEGHVT
jgi:hypothetical protein